MKNTSLSRSSCIVLNQRNSTPINSELREFRAMKKVSEEESTPEPEVHDFKITKNSSKYKFLSGLKLSTKSDHSNKSSKAQKDSSGTAEGEFKKSNSLFHKMVDMGIENDQELGA